MRDAAGRLVDLAGAAALGVAAAPLVGLAACAIVATSGRPAFYAGERLGRDERPFACYKLRTMCAARVTRVGAMLRATHVDELPQLWNVLRGEMRLVGPRPLPAAAFADRPALRRLRCTVAPGLTGLAQIRTHELAPSAEAMLANDLAYVRERSVALDLAILARTPAMLVRTTLQALRRAIGLARAGEPHDVSRATRGRPETPRRGRRDGAPSAGPSPDDHRP